MGNIVDEGTVDLQHIKGKTLQVTQRGIASTEIIQCQAKPQLFKGMNNIQGLV